MMKLEEWVERARSVSFGCNNRRTIPVYSNKHEHKVYVDRRGDICHIIHHHQRTVIRKHLGLRKFPNMENSLAPVFSLGLISRMSY